MSSARFRATLVDGPRGLACEMPFDPAERWSLPMVSIEARRRGVEVAATVGKSSFDTHVVTRAGSHWLLVGEERAKKAGLRAGEEVAVVVAPRGAPSKHPMKIAAGAGEKALARLRGLCESLPESYEKVAWGAPTFRAGVKGKIYAMFDDHHAEGRIAVLCPAPEGMQRELVASDGALFFVPPYVGPSGWIGIRLDRKIKDAALLALLEQAYRMIAPPRLAGDASRLKT